MNTVLEKYVPEKAVAACVELIKINQVHLKIVNERLTRHGDYRRNPDGTHQITVNASLNKYKFLITLIHEIAHLVAFKKYGNRIKPHGVEWKHTFRELMLPFIHPAIFPAKLLSVVAHHFKNPTASSDTDAKLALSLSEYDKKTDKNYIFEVPYGEKFRIYNGKIFRKGNKRVKRYECIEVSSGKVYLFQPHAEVELLF